MIDTKIIECVRFNSLDGDCMFPVAPFVRRCNWCNLPLCCRTEVGPNWAKTTRRLWSASTIWPPSSKPRGAWQRPSLFTTWLLRRAWEPSFRDFKGTGHWIWSHTFLDFCWSIRFVMTETGACNTLGTFSTRFGQKLPKLHSFQSTSWQMP